MSATIVLLLLKLINNQFFASYVNCTSHVQNFRIRTPRYDKRRPLRPPPLAAAGTEPCYAARTVRNHTLTKYRRDAKASAVIFRRVNESSGSPLFPPPPPCFPYSPLLRLERRRAKPRCAGTRERFNSVLIHVLRAVSSAPNVTPADDDDDDEPTKPEADDDGRVYKNPRNSRHLPRGRGQAAGPNAVSVREIQNWFKRFQSSNFDVKDEPRSGGPVPDKVYAILEKVEQDQYGNPSRKVPLGTDLVEVARAGGSYLTPTPARSPCLDSVVDSLYINYLLYDTNLGIHMKDG
ncbi:hypothetical protein EVAR_36413_1 [Eumeta japonica]|uniref:Mos1 transposase HTH domain-containing protein n=1 Tax=Eumeta variegata TaxID=151549 RepID=A0A4C1VQP3_EUMVA|nr:hypothetical protein EVAR_36413_1 [Eumeta japonica]